MAIIVVIVVLALFAAYFFIGNPTSGPKTYSGDALSFQYPGSWKLQPAASGPQHGDFQSVVAMRTPSTSASIYGLSIWREVNGPVAGGDEFQYWKKSLQLNDGEVSDITVGGSPAFQGEHDKPSATVNGTVLQAYKDYSVYVLHDNYVYWIEFYVGQDSTADSRIAEFNSLLNSIQFKN